MVGIEGAMHDHHGSAFRRRRTGAQGKGGGIVAVIDGADFFARIPLPRQTVRKFIRDGAHAVHLVADRQRNLIAHQGVHQRLGGNVGRPGFHEARQEVGKIHHHGQTETLLQFAGGHGGNGVLRKNQIEFYCARGGGHHALQKKRVGEIF